MPSFNTQRSFQATEMRLTPTACGYCWFVETDYMLITRAVLPAVMNCSRQFSYLAVVNYRIRLSIS